MFCFLLCRLARQVLWAGMRWRKALDVFCKRQTEVIKAFLNERGVMRGDVFADCELEALKKMYVWREGRLLGWLKRNEFEHLPNTTRAAVVWIVLGRQGIKLTRRDVRWAGMLLRVVERMRVGGEWRGRRGLKMGNLRGWMKRQLERNEAGVLPARYRHVVEVLGWEGVLMQAT